MTFLNNAIVSNEGKVDQQQVSRLIEAFTVVHNLISQNPQPIIVPRAPDGTNDAKLANNPLGTRQLVTLSNGDSSIPSIKPIVSFAPNTDQNTTIPITIRSEGNSSAIPTTSINFNIVSTDAVTRVPAPVALIHRPETLQETKPAVRTEAQHLLNNNIVQALTLLNVIQATPFSNWNAVLGDKQGTTAPALTEEQPKSKASTPELVTIRMADPAPVPAKSHVVVFQTERFQPTHSVLATPVMHTASNIASHSVASREIALDHTEHVKSVIESGYLQLTNNISSKTPVDTIFAAVIESAEKQLGRPMNIQEMMVARDLVYTDAARQITDIGSATPYSGSLTTTIKSGGGQIHSTGNKASSQSSLTSQNSIANLTSQSQRGPNSLQVKRNQKAPLVFTVSARTALTAGIAI
jgi:hypothetical protein